MHLKKLYLNMMMLGLLIKNILNHIYWNILMVSYCPDFNKLTYLSLIIVLI